MDFELSEDTILDFSLWGLDGDLNNKLLEKYKNKEVYFSTIPLYYKNTEDNINTYKLTCSESKKIYDEISVCTYKNKLNHNFRTSQNVNFVNEFNNFNNLYNWLDTLNKEQFINILNKYNPEMNEIFDPNFDNMHFVTKFLVKYLDASFLFIYNNYCDYFCLQCLNMSIYQVIGYRRLYAFKDFFHFLIKRSRHIIQSRVLNLSYELERKILNNMNYIEYKIKEYDNKKYRIFEFSPYEVFDFSFEKSKEFIYLLKEKIPLSIFTKIISIGEHYGLLIKNYVIDNMGIWKKEDFIQYWKDITNEDILKEITNININQNTLNNLREYLKENIQDNLNDIISKISNLVGLN